MSEMDKESFDKVLAKTREFVKKHDVTFVTTSANKGYYTGRRLSIPDAELLFCADVNKKPDGELTLKVNKTRKSGEFVFGPITFPPSNTG